MIDFTIPTDYGRIEILSLGKRDLVENDGTDWNLYCKKTIRNFHKDESEEIYSLDQIHSDAIWNTQEIKSDSKGDGLYTSEYNQTLVIRTADCVPILVWSFDYPFIGAIHSGWKGTQLGITEKFISNTFNKTVKGLDRQSKITNPKIGFYIGSHILAKDYEVSEDVASYFLESGFAIAKDTAGKYNLDLSGYIQSKIKDYYPKALVINVNESTLDSPNWFSHRSGDKGRNLHCIRILKD
ncbi:polyphenol oxidase family protein [Leptospira sp. GIMC2001]|uniref:polyphenol oxidase family protein n=1 Tax=Leptospira sp. GIMC2001 TaxID=1513297 RepID=UPI00234B72F0|nr:polyphenol oxidase family protein [Leptospira sp. GIMC2001]WCL48637.1 polyphenol oxidase family protein [Leptospira sp. GIMC2001]